MTHRFYTAAACAVWAALAGTADAQHRVEDIVQADILTGWRTAEGDHVAALRLRLAQGWKTYWRTPGDAGIPPRFDWSASENIADVAVHWPTPSVSYQNGMRSVGYEGTVILPLTIATDAAGSAVSIDSTVEIGICEEVCIPVTLALTGELLPDATARDGRIAAALADQPLNRDEAGVRGVSCAIEPLDDGLRLTAVIDMPRLGRDEEVVIETADPTLWVSDGPATRTNAGLSTTVDIIPAEMKPFPLERSTLGFTVIADGQAVSITGCG